MSTQDGTKSKLSHEGGPGGGADEDSSSLFSDALSEETPEMMALDAGELAYLSSSMMDLDVDESKGANAHDDELKRSDSLLLTSLNTDASYGKPLSHEEAAKRMPPGNEGLMRHALVLPDNYFRKNKLMGGLNPRDFNKEDGSIKPRRATLPLTMTQLLSSLTKVDGPNGPRWIFHGVLNGWPSLRTFELVALDKKRSIGPLSAPAQMNSHRLNWSKHWHVDKEGASGIPPNFEQDPNKIYLAKLRGAPWTSNGW